eukprot:860590_1
MGNILKWSQHGDGDGNIDIIQISNSTQRNCNQTNIEDINISNDTQHKTNETHQLKIIHAGYVLLNNHSTFAILKDTQLLFYDDISNTAKLNFKVDLVNCTSISTIQ